MATLGGYHGAKSLKSTAHPESERQPSHALYPVNGGRLQDLLTNTSDLDGPSSQDKTLPDLLRSFHHFMTPTLPHLLALVLHPNSTVFPPALGLLVVDSISTLVNHAFNQRPRDFSDTVSSKKGDVARWASNRRWAVMADIISALEKIASMRNIAIVLISQSTTKLSHGSAALLQPATSGVAWECGIKCRILLFYDWRVETKTEAGQPEVDAVADIRFASAIKVGGVSCADFDEIVPFAVEKHGLRLINVSSATVGTHEPTSPPPAMLKRKRSEVADSESETGDPASDDEFGWVGDGSLTTA
ncbi:MAG: hypothetical protein Q9220_004795 [cf. Caloplaca sp. 1 TL-2023]